jgi:hypothetical protein
LENGQRLVEHLTMLGGDGDADTELFRARLQTADDGREFDRFGAGAENEQGAYHSILTMAESDTALGEVVGGKFEGDFVAGQNADAIAAEAAGEVGQNKPFVLKLDTEFTAGEFLDDRTLYFDAVFFTHFYSIIVAEPAGSAW